MVRVVAADDIHWEELEVEWDGSRFTLHVPHALHDWQARWLEQNLPMALRGLMGEAHVEVSGAGQGSRIPGVGSLSIGPLALPLRGGQVGAPGKLREIVDRAAADADAAARQAIEHADAFRSSLVAGSAVRETRRVAGGPRPAEPRL